MAHAVRLTPDALRQVRAGHPWVFDKSIRSGPDNAGAGDLAVIFDDKRRFAAIGLWDPTSPIRMRVLHVGKPVEIGSEWITDKIQSALGKRAELAEDSATTGWRVVHGENDGLPGLVVDKYSSVMVIKLDTPAWLHWLEDVTEALGTLMGPTAMVLRASRHVQGVEDGAILQGSIPADGVPFLENGLQFAADVVAGNKTGHFLDHRDNREFVRGMAQGKSVLDVFCSNGGFSVYAAAGGATAVTSVDISAGAIEACAHHMQLNASHCEHEAVQGDAFVVLDQFAQQGRQFDLVVVDPPSFASKADDVSRALRSYRRLTAAALRVLTPGGTLVQASCSSRVEEESFFYAVHDAANSQRRPLAEIRRTGHAADHPIGFVHGAYLKTMFATT